MSIAEFILILFLCSAAVAVVGYTYAEILVHEPVLNWWYKLLDRKIGHIEFIFLPLVGCYKCVTGQMALWSYLIYSIVNGGYNIFAHIYFICQAIFTAIVIYHLMRRIEQ